MPGKKYMLEIYRPENVNDVWMYFESDSPFMNMSYGDIINAETWPEAGSGAKLLRIINIEHLIWEAEGISKHKLMVYTKEVENIPANLLNRE